MITTTKSERKRTVGTRKNGRIKHRISNAVDAERMSAWKNPWIFECSIAHGARGDLTNIFIRTNSRCHLFRVREKIEMRRNENQVNSSLQRYQN